MTHEPRVGRMKRALLVTLGVVFLAIAPLGAMALWVVLPEGVYPTVLVGLPALPALWIGFVCLSRAGLPVDAWIRERPWHVGCATSALAIIIAFFLMAFFGD